MKTFICILLTIVEVTANAQKKVSEDSLIKKWKLATINIEATTSLFMEPSINLEFKEKMDTSNMSKSEKDQQWINLTKNKVGVSGTAIFLEYENIHFLITARHVLEDSYFSSPGFPYNQLSFPEDFNIASSINFIPAFFNLMSFDSNLHVGNFIFSPKDTDIAIVALDAYEYQTELSNIPKILNDRGYLPIDITAIDTNYLIRSGDLTYSIGFPDLSMKGKKTSIDTFEAFQSNTVSLPVVSVGKVMDIKKTTHYLISDVFVYHGNSGGPLIYNNKLIGIVHGPNLEVREAENTKLKSYYFLNGNEFIKANVVMPLLRELLMKIKENKFKSAFK